MTAGDKKHVEISVPYAAGMLEAVAWRDGKEIGRRMLTTAGKPASLRLAPELARGYAHRGHVSYVLVEVLDREGRLVPDAEVRIDLDITGPSDLAAFGSATPFAIGSLQTPSTTTWHGRALAILRGRDGPGDVRIVATAPGLQSDSINLPFV